MAFKASLSSRFYVGSQHFSVFARGFSFTRERMALETTVLTSTAHEFIPGQLNGTASLDLLLDGSGATPSEFITITNWLTTPQVVTLAPSGTTAGSEAWLLLANDSQSAITSAVADVVSAAVTIQCDGPEDAGIVLDPETAYMANNTTTGLDNGALTSNGGVAHLHVTAFSGFTSDTILVEHSTDNAAWATLGTFATVTGLTSERLVIAPGTTVNRWLRVKDTVVGSGSVSRTVSFARR